MRNSRSVDYGLRHFAVLHHTGVTEPHYDFLFDTSDESRLVAFRLRSWPLTAGTQAVTKLPDHRRVYLTYEGDIRGGRGHVDRVAAGTARVVGTSGGWILTSVEGEPIASFESHPPGDGWSVTVAAPGVFEATSVWPKQCR